MATYHLEKMSHGAISKLDPARTAVVVAISPLEVHGPHLPVGQDLFEATALMNGTVKAVAKTRTDWDFLMLPPIPVATDCVPALGSVSYPATLVRQVAYHALLPFAKAGFARLAYSSFHGGPRHICALEDAADRLPRRTGAAAMSLFSAVVARAVEGNFFFDGIAGRKDRRIELDQVKQDHHAGFIETSLALHLWPDLVDDGWQSLPHSVADPGDAGAKGNRAFFFGYTDQAGLAERVARNVARVRSVVRGIRHFRTSTYFGYPNLASAAQGKALFAHVVGACAEIVGEFLDRGREMDGHSPLWPAKDLFLSAPVNKVVDDWLKVFSE